ncbi:MAG: exopolysaccharide biosynthesis protein [Balneolaceae bacterium]
MADHEPTNLNQLFDIIEESVNETDEQVTLGNILKVIGSRSFGPTLLFAGIITLAPIVGDIPGVPTIMGTFVFLISVQLLLGKKSFWLPDWILNRSVKPEKLSKSIEWLRRPAKFIDRFLKPRLTTFSTGIATHFIAVTCILVAAAMPIMEFVPFSANGAGAVLTLFGLTLIARDGLLAVAAFVILFLTVFLITYNFL